MSSADAKALVVTVLSPEGQMLGTLAKKPTNPSWRLLGQAPQVVLGSAATRRLVRLERHGEGWGLRLVAGEKLPTRLRPAQPVGEVRP